MGVVAFALCAGFLPFCFDDSSDTLKAICCDCLLFPFWVGKSLVRVIQAMLKQNPQERISSVEVFQEFKDLVSYYKKRKNFTVPPSNRARELTMKENIRNQRASFHIKKRIQTRNGTSVRIAPGKIERSSWTPSPKTTSRSRIETLKNENKSNESTVSARSSWTPSPRANKNLRLKTLKSKEKSGDNKVSLRPLRSSLPSPLSRRKNQLRNDNNNNNKTIDRETLQRSTKPSNVPSPISTKNSREALPCPTKPINSPVQLNHLKHAWSRKQAEESPRDHIRSKGMILHRNKQHEQKEQVGESPRRVAITQPRAKGNNLSPRHVEESTRDHIRNIGMILHRKKQHGQKKVKESPRRSRPSTPTQSQSKPKSKGHLAPLFDKKKANR